MCALSTQAATAVPGFIIPLQPCFSSHTGSWAGPCLVVYLINPFEDPSLNFKPLFFTSWAKFLMRRADAEKLGCLIFRIKNTKSHFKMFLPPPTSRYFNKQHMYACLKANIHVLQSESSPTAIPSPATLLGWCNDTQRGFMASWRLQRDAWIRTWHTRLPSPSLCS